MTKILSSAIGDGLQMGNGGRAWRSGACWRLSTPVASTQPPLAPWSLPVTPTLRCAIFLQAAREVSDLAKR